MPSKSKSQQRFFGMVHAYQKGELKGKDVSDSIKDAAKSMTKKDVNDFAETKHKGLPNHVKKNKKGKSKKKMKENKTRVFRISESQYKEIMTLLNEEGKDLAVRYADSEEKPATTSQLDTYDNSLKQDMAANGINTKDTDIKREFTTGSGYNKKIWQVQDKASVDNGITKESILLSKRQVEEMRIHNRNKHSKLMKLKDFIG